MGLFSFLGPILGAGLVGGGKGKAALSALGGVLTNRAGERRQDSSIERIVASAGRAGVHPLAALGSSAAGLYGSPIGASHSGDAVGDRYSADKALSAQIELMRAQMDTEKAKQAALIAEATSRTGISNMRRNGTGGNSPIPLWVQFEDRDGNIHWGPNPDLPDIEQAPMPGVIQTITNPIVRDPVIPRIDVGPPRRGPVIPRDRTGANRTPGSIRW